MGLEFCQAALAFCFFTVKNASCALKTSRQKRLTHGEQSVGKHICYTQLFAKAEIYADTENQNRADKRIE